MCARAISCRSPNNFGRQILLRVTADECVPAESRISQIDQSKPQCIFVWVWWVGWDKMGKGDFDLNPTSDKNPSQQQSKLTIMHGGLGQAGRRAAATM